nr:hypothetical protein [Mycobacterium sp. D16Q16]
MLALSPADRVRCVWNLATAALRGGLRQELTSWRETATALAAGLGSAKVEWLDSDDADAVERP